MSGQLCWRVHDSTPKHISQYIRHTFCTPKHILYNIQTFILHTKAYSVVHTNIHFAHQIIWRITYIHSFSYQNVQCIIIHIVWPSVIGRTWHAGYECHIFLSDADLTTQNMAATSFAIHQWKSMLYVGYQSSVARTKFLFAFLLSRNRPCHIMSHNILIILKLIF